MTAKKIIPCLDIKDGKVVKGVHFEGIREMGDPIELAKEYSEGGADELVLLDITATTEGRKTFTDLIKNVKKVISVPLTVGGGIGSIDDIYRVLEAGADKVGINSAAVKDPLLIKKASEEFGSGKIVAAIDAKKVGDAWHVMVRGGLEDANIEAISWAKQTETLGAGSILLTSVDKDGVRDGYDLELTKAVADAVHIPVIASGGCGNAEHIAEVLNETGAASALAASIFHNKMFTVGEVKRVCENRGVSFLEA